MDAVDSRRGEVGDEIVQQAEGAQSVSDAVEGLRADILDEIPLEIQAGEGVEALEGLGARSARQFAYAVLRQIEEGQSPQASERVWHLLLPRALEIEILQGPLQAAERTRSERHLVIGELQRDQLGAGERVVVHPADLVDREIENGEIPQGAQIAARDLRELVVLEVQAPQVVLLAGEGLRLDAPDAAAGHLHVVDPQRYQGAIPQYADRAVVDVEEVHRRLGGVASHRQQ